ncbi:nuclear transport factor 2 family protein [Sinomicrobium kalidii]|uniref:nuclear transport factor 2 family protein n=1 Tax=Sinomicrobium kalidii TaxID=2900738 RepID=UPI001E2D9FF4|nr:nuclear transport factor 2 family protein [Sinomicrobium kalidii]UGU15940.1 nuclear transport factor 2 family protein [Sinomicrobium kalidii]
MKRFLLPTILLFFANVTFSQNNESQIKTALMNYINGTSYNETKLIDQAFYPEANLYLTKDDNEPWIVPISEYTSWFKKAKKGQFNGRIGNILYIEDFNTIALAKAEILNPDKNITYIDMFLLKKIQNEWKIISKTADSEASNLSGDRILFIVSNAHYYGDSELPTGNSYSEIVNAYDTFKKAGYIIDFVSPEGGSIPLAYINTTDSVQKAYLYNSDFMFSLKHTKKPDEINPEDYKAVHYIGGGSAMFGVPENTGIQKIVMTIYEEQEGIISSVCHGTAGIVHLKTKNGKYLVNGKTVNGYPDAFEREGAEYFKQFPFLITKTIEERGGTFTYSPRNSIHVEEDGNLITGQNYLSSKHVALRIIEKLESKYNDL